MSVAYQLAVDYSLTLKQMIEAGNYDWVNDFFKNNDPIEGQPTADHPQGDKFSGSGAVEVNLELLHFNEVISTNEVTRRIKERGLIHAKAEHLLALGAAHPELQREFPIVALGSIWQRSRGGRGVPYLWGDDGGRSLRLYWGDDDWYGRCRFLVVGK